MKQPTGGALTRYIVALRVRAWIETIFEGITKSCSVVALRVRAWIETHVLWRESWNGHVALRVRAWIETIKQ